VGAKERRKGHVFEREVAKTLREAGFEAERILEYAEGVGWDVSARSEDPEVQLNLFVQCKRRKRIALLSEIEGGVSTEARWFWAVRQDRGQAYAVTSLEQMVELLQLAEQGLRRV
jgi:hypothetical protein